MNTLPLIRSHTQRAERLHKAQLIATAKGSKYHDNAILNAGSASRKAKAKLLQNAQLMAFNAISKVSRFNHCPQR